MAKEAYWFSHDSNASSDEKILNLRADLGWEGYGLYWAIIERLRDSSDYQYGLNSLKGLAISLGVKLNLVEKIIGDYDLFEKNDDFFWSNSLDERMKLKDEIRDKRKEAAKNRWKKSTPPLIEKSESRTTITKGDIITTFDSDANVMQMQCKSDANAMQMQINEDANTMLLKGKEKKGKEKKGKEIENFNKNKLGGDANFDFQEFSKSQIIDIFIKNNPDLTTVQAAAEFEKFFFYYASRGWQSKDGIILNPIVAAENWNPVKTALSKNGSKTVNVIHSQKSRVEDTPRRIAATDALIDSMYGNKVN